MSEYNFMSRKVKKKKQKTAKPISVNGPLMG